jgi:hypothetical protein
LHDGLLRLAEILICALQRRVKLSLVRRERDMLTQLPEELAFLAAEARRCPARGDQHAKHVALDDEWRGDERPQSARRQPLRKRRRHERHVRLVDQFPSHTA